MAEEVAFHPIKMSGQDIAEYIAEHNVMLDAIEPDDGRAPQLAAADAIYEMVASETPELLAYFEAQPERYPAELKKPGFWGERFMPKREARPPAPADQGPLVLPEPASLGPAVKALERAGIGFPLAEKGYLLEKFESGTLHPDTLEVDFSKAAEDSPEATAALLRLGEALIDAPWIKGKNLTATARAVRELYSEKGLPIPTVMPESPKAPSRQDPLKAVGAARSPDEHRYNLQFVVFDPKKKAFIATDGHRIYLDYREAEKPTASSDVTPHVDDKGREFYEYNKLSKEWRPLPRPPGGYINDNPDRREKGHGPQFVEYEAITDSWKASPENPAHTLTLTQSQAAQLSQALVKTLTRYKYKKPIAQHTVRLADFPVAMNPWYLKDAFNFLLSGRPAEITLRIAGFDDPVKMTALAKDRSTLADAYVMPMRPPEDKSISPLFRDWDWAKYGAAKPQASKPRRGGSSRVPAMRAPEEAQPVLAPAEPSRVDATGQVELPGLNMARGPEGANRPPFLDRVDPDRLSKPPNPADPSRDPVLREDVLRKFLRAINQPIYMNSNSRHRLMKRRKALGYYVVGNAELAIDNYSDLEVAAHEIAHRMQDEFGSVLRDIYDPPRPRRPKSPWSPTKAANWATTPISQEIQNMSYDTTLPFEGFAEFVRAWMTNPSLAAKDAPEAVKWWEGWINNEAPATWRNALLEAQQGMTAWYAQSPLDQMRSMARESIPVENYLRTWRSEYMQTVVDKFDAIGRAEVALTGELAPASKEGPYRIARMTAGIPDLSLAAMQRGIPEYFDPKTGNSALGELLAGQEPTPQRYRAAIAEYIEQLAAGKAEPLKPAEAVTKGAGPALFDVIRRVELLDVKNLDGTPWQAFEMQVPQAFDTLLSGLSPVLGRKLRDKAGMPSKKWVPVSISSPLEAWSMYVYARGAKEDAEMGVQNLWRADQIEDALKLGEVNPEFEALARELDEIHDRLLMFSVANEVIDLKTGLTWMNRRRFYVPNFRVGRTPKLYKKRTGGVQNVRPLITNLIDNIHLSIEHAVTNRAKLAIVRGLENKSGAGTLFTRPLPDDSQKVRIYKRQIEQRFLEEFADTTGVTLDPDKSLDELTGADLVPQDPELGQGILDTWHGMKRVLEVFGPTNPRGDRIFSYQAHGKPVYREVPLGSEMLLRSIQSLNHRPYGPLQKIIRAIQTPSAWAQSTVTTSPEFMTANMVRAEIEGPVLSENKARPLVTTLRGIRERTRGLLSGEESEMYDLYMYNLAGMASLRFTERNARARAMRAADVWAAGKGINPKVLINSPAKLNHMISEMVNLSELAARLGTFAEGVQRGEHPMDMAWEARAVIQPDFGMMGDRTTIHGEIINGVMGTILFQHAAIQGFHRTVHGLGLPHLVSRAKEQITGEKWRDEQKRERETGGRERPLRGKGAVEGVDYSTAWADTATKATVVALAGFALTAWNLVDPFGLEDGGFEEGSGDNYDELPSWARQLAWHVYMPTPAWLMYKSGLGEKPLPGNGSAYTHFWIPKPHEIGAASTVIEEAEIASWQLQEEGLEDLTSAAVKQKAFQVGEVFFREAWTHSPIPGIPYVLTPAVEAYAGKRMHTGAPLHPPYLPGEPGLRSSERTPRWLAERGIESLGEPPEDQFDPSFAEHLIARFFNYWGGYANMAIDSALYGESDLPPHKNPFIRRFYKGRHPMRSSTLTKARGMMETIAEYEATRREVVQRGRSDMLERIDERHPMAAQLQDVKSIVPKFDQVVMSPIRRDFRAAIEYTNRARSMATDSAEDLVALQQLAANAFNDTYIDLNAKSVIPTKNKVKGLGPELAKRAGLAQSLLQKRGVWNDARKLKRELVNAGVRAQNIRGAQWATTLENILIGGKK